MKKTIIAALALSILSGCASQPENIKAINTQPAKFETMTCEQMVTQATFITDRSAVLHQELLDLAGNDAAQMAVALVAFAPAVLFLEGGDGVEAFEYAQLKGDSLQLNKKAKEIGCELPNTFEVAEEPEKAAEPKKGERKGMYSVY